MTITILTHDERWKGLAPTVKRAAEAAFSSFNSPLEGESTRCFNAAVGGKALKDAPHGCAKGTSRSPSRGEQEKASVTLVLSNDAEVKALNRDYRGKNKPTNVLSFPDGSMDEGDGCFFLLPP